MDAGEWLHYAQCVWNDAALSVLLTASGESAELVELMKTGGARPLGLISNNTASTCWQLTENRLPVLAGPEYGNATKTYTNSACCRYPACFRDAGTALAGRCGESCRDLRRHSRSGSSLSAAKAWKSFVAEAANIEIAGSRCRLWRRNHERIDHPRNERFSCCRPHWCRFQAWAKPRRRRHPRGNHFTLGRAASLGVKLADECIRRGGKVVLVSS